MKEIEADPQLERSFLLKKYPCEWIATLGSGGRRLGLYDKAQQLRNRNCKWAENRQEKLLIYTIVLSKSSNLEPTMYSLDMLELLGEQEVLSFGVDDFVNDHFAMVCVQAKDLALYIIDFEKQQVIRKIQGNRFSIVMKSIFFDPDQRDFSG